MLELLFVIWCLVGAAIGWPILNTQIGLLQTFVLLLCGPVVWFILLMILFVSFGNWLGEKMSNND